MQERMAKQGLSCETTYMSFCKCSRHLDNIAQQYNISQQDAQQAVREALSMGLLRYLYGNNDLHTIVFTQRGLTMVLESKSGVKEKSVPQIHLNNCTNIQIGDCNTMNIQQQLEMKIDQSTGTPQEKEKAKSLLKTVMLDNILAPIIGALAGASAAAFLEG
jgi:hypothetical protein